MSSTNFQAKLDSKRVKWLPFYMFNELFNNLSSMELVFAGGLFVMFTTTLGAVTAVAFKEFPEWGLDLSMAFSGGIMLVASFTSLILPSVAEGNIIITCVGIILGFLTILIVERSIPHEHFWLGYEGPEKHKEKLKRVWLIAIALIIHNLPEGFAVGVSIINNTHKGIATTLAIGIQDIPEGLAVSLPLMMITKRIKEPLLIGFLSGFSEFLTAIIGGWTFSILKFLLPLGLSMAGGAMIYVTVKEVFPEVYKSERERLITCSFLTGFLVMLILDTVLG